VAISIRSNPSRRVDAITFTTAGGGSVTLSGSTIQLRLRLRSSWFALRLLDLRSVRRVRHRVTVAGTVSPTGAVRVEGLVDGQWLLLGKVSARNGSISWRGPDHGATAFRLRAGSARSAVVRRR
jgi:hypothetical protein